MTLIQKLRDASGPSRELDAEIYAATHEPLFGRTWEPNTLDETGDRPGSVGIGPYMAQSVEAPEYTADVNAVHALIDHFWGEPDDFMLFGLWRGRHKYPPDETGRWTWTGWTRAHAKDETQVEHKVPAIALLLAFLTGDNSPLTALEMEKVG